GFSSVTKTQEYLHRVPPRQNSAVRMRRLLCLVGRFYERLPIQRTSSSYFLKEFGNHATTT
ncbi:MAG: hypothetical protein KAV87_12255, partial [Desulfobacteraceae bacterium]|nr:hypothetical protein [Desulfobacteraceae bacterium]